MRHVFLTENSHFIRIAPSATRTGGDLRENCHFHKDRPHRSNTNFSNTPLIFHDSSLTNFLTNWRAQRGNVLTISLIYHDSSLTNFLTKCRAQRGKFLTISLISRAFSYEILHKLARAARKIFQIYH